MKINEYQSKSILRKHDIFVPKGIVASSVNEAINGFRDLGGKPCVVKAQILAGGRGKGGGVKLAETEETVRCVANEILGSTIVTHQTGPSGICVEKVLVEESVSIDKEFYLAIVVDRTASSPVLIVSSEGGVEIEETAVKLPEKIIKEIIDPAFGIHEFQSRQIAKALSLEGACLKKFSKFIASLFKIFYESDCLLLEINPLALTADGHLCALDVKIEIDDNALFRHDELVDANKCDDRDSLESKAFKSGLSYINLGGDIGCMVNGAGLAMATMDIIKLHGGVPANFLDVGGDASVEKVKYAFGLILADKRVKAVLVNIFGGIMKCDVIALGIVQAVKEIKSLLPLVVRLEGTNVEIAKDIIKNSGLDIIYANGMEDAADKVVQVTNNNQC